jgi:hypothetical protein
VEKLNNKLAWGKTADIIEKYVVKGKEIVMKERS